MVKIQDDGKVWLKGSVGTAHAVRVDNKIFTTGKKEDQSIDLWLENDGLCLDLHNSKLGERTARFIPLKTPTTLQGTLFNGFDKTKHADVLIVAFDHEGTKEASVSGEQYKEGNYNSLTRLTFWKTIWNDREINQ
jgi:hypothetical protein